MLVIFPRYREGRVGLLKPFYKLITAIRLKCSSAIIICPGALTRITPGVTSLVLEYCTEPASFPHKGWDFVDV